MPAPVPRRDGVLRRDAILDAALVCFNRDGVLETTVTALRAESGASASSLYHHFGGVPAVATALLRRSFQRMFVDLTAAVIATCTARDAVETLVQSYLAWVFTHRDEAAFIYQMTALDVSPGDREEMARFKATLYLPLVTHLSPFIARGELPALAPPLYDVLLLGQAHEAGRRWVAGAPYLDPAWLSANLPRLAWAMIDGLRCEARD